MPDKASFWWYQVGLSALKLWQEVRYLKPCQVDLIHFLALLAFFGQFSVVSRSKKLNVLPDKAHFGRFMLGYLRLDCGKRLEI